MLRGLLKASQSSFVSGINVRITYHSLIDSPRRHWIHSHRFCNRLYSETAQIMANGMDSADAALFRSIGLKETVIKNLMKNNQSSVSALKECIAEVERDTSSPIIVGREPS